MKIILSYDDIKDLIKEKYSQVETISCEHDDIEIEVTVGKDFFKNKKDVIEHVAPIVIPKDARVALTPMEKAEQEAANGVMASGGTERTLARF
jgi:hypothetical protein